MTAVAPPPNFQPISRSGWSAPNGTSNGLAPSPDEVSRMFMPRRTVQRTGSSSSIASTASSNGTITAATAQTNGFSTAGPGDGSAWGTKKKNTRGLWPPSDPKPVAGLSTARSQPIASSSSGTSAASAISALHTPSSMLPSQQNGQVQTQQNGHPRAPMQTENPAVLYLIPMNGTFEKKTITVPFYPEVMKIGRQTNNKTQPTPLNGYFDSKVLSRQHAEIWADRNGKIWIRDVKSSNGTFVNGQRLSQENRDSDPHELREQDMLELGIDIVSEDQRTIVHHKVAARVEHAGFYNPAGGNVLDLNFGDLDSPSNGLAGAGFSQGMMRSRPGSQGSMSSGVRTPASVAGTNMSAMSQQRHINFWLQPISMEQVVKRLNTELKQAKQQSHDLQRTSQYIDSILTSDPKKEVAKSPPSSIRPSPIKENKARFSDPPAPPPQQPLPEKPDVAPYQSLLRRNDTERPRLNGSPVRSDSASQLNSLTEALTSARKEIESQSVRLKDLEKLLAQERLARESAEERAQRLEAEAKKEMASEEISREAAPEAPADDEALEVEAEEQVEQEPASEVPGSAIVDAATSRLQQRLEKMVAEMDEMKQQMEKYRQRAETAEAESAQNRQTLAEMVEKIRKDEAERQAKSSSTSPTRRNGLPNRPHYTMEGAQENGVVKEPSEPEGGIEKAREVLRKAGVQNGRPVTPEQAEELEKALSQALAIRPASAKHHELLTHGAPVISMVTVVLAGAALMAWLNSWPKVER